MARTVIFVDGEYLRKIFDRRGYRLDLPKVIGKILKLTKIDENDLLRVYLYTSPPYQSSSPTEEEKQRYRSFQKFMNFLQKQDNFEIRLGRTEKRGSEFEQKMVDVLLSVDLVELSARAKIETAILVAGDSDFVPAIKKAKYNGVRTILVCSSYKNEYHQHLWNEVDRRIHINSDFMSECSYSRNKKLK